MKTVFISLSLAFFSFLSFTDEPVVAPTAPAGTAPPPVALGEPEYTGEQLQIKKRMDALFDASHKVNAAGAEKQKSRSEIEAALDWDKVAQVCLGAANYKKQTPTNFGEFKRLLKDVVVHTAYSRLDKFWADDTKYKLSKIEVKGTTAVVVSKFSVKGETFALEYFLNKKGGHWVVWDISYEGERYSVNINEQIDAFLKERSFAGLLEKLKKRREELADEAKTSGKG